MRLVLDTNVVIAGLAADGLCRDLLKRRVLAHDLFISVPMVEELAEKLRDKFDVDPQDLPLFTLYVARASFVTPGPLATPVCRDPDDDVVLGTAVAANAQALITGDKDLLSLKEHNGIPILSPRSFIEWSEGLG